MLFRQNKIHGEMQNCMGEWTISTHQIHINILQSRSLNLSCLLGGHFWCAFTIFKIIIKSIKDFKEEPTISCKLNFNILHVLGKF